MWTRYQVELKFNTPFASSTPKNSKGIDLMLKARMPSDARIKKRQDVGAETRTIAVLQEDISQEIGADEALESGCVTFRSDELGLYYEGRCVRAHLKDCANILQSLLKIKALKAKVANRVYVFPEKIYLGKKQTDGKETRIIHAMTMRGPRSSFKTIEYVNDVTLIFELRVLDDGVVDINLLKALFEYGGVHGMGQERSQDWGKYRLTRLEQVL